MDDVIVLDFGKIAQELGLRAEQVAGVTALLDEGNTVPFITRYRKERTGNLDEEQIRQIQSRVESLRQLNDRANDPAIDRVPGKSHRAAQGGHPRGGFAQAARRLISALPPQTPLPRDPGQRARPGTLCQSDLERLAQRLEFGGIGEGICRPGKGTPHDGRGARGRLGHPRGADQRERPRPRHRPPDRPADRKPRRLRHQARRGARPGLPRLFRPRRTGCKNPAAPGAGDQPRGVGEDAPRQVPLGGRPRPGKPGEVLPPPRTSAWGVSENLRRGCLVPIDPAQPGAGNSQGV